MRSSRLFTNSHVVDLSLTYSYEQSSVTITLSMRSTCTGHWRMCETLNNDRECRSITTAILGQCDGASLVAHPPGVHSAIVTIAAGSNMTMRRTVGLCSLPPFVVAFVLSCH